MGEIDKYIIRMTLVAFLLVLVSLTGIIWITQALRGLDLMTGQGQTILVFLGITGLGIPVLAMIIAPIALLIAVTFTLNRLTSESEIIVMSAAGLSPWRFLRPFLIVTTLVGIFVAFLSFYLVPESLRNLRRWQADIGADVLTNILRPGDFVRAGALTFRIQERLPGGLLSGIFIDDQRNAAERVDIIAEKGLVQKNDRGSFLILQDGNFQRYEVGKRDPTFVAFKSYAFDLSQFANGNQNISFGPRERPVRELIWPPADDPIASQLAGNFRSELHDRVLAPMYAFVLVMVAFAVLGPPRTTRQTRNFAIAILIVSIIVVRIAGFGLSTIAPKIPSAIFVQYALLAGVSTISIFMILRGVVVDAPTMLPTLFKRILARFWALRPA